MSNRLFWRVFQKRSLICFFIIIVLLFVTVLRVSVISTSNYSAVAENMSSIKIKISNNRGTIFDCNKYPITNSEKRIIACISPTPRAITAISQILQGQELQSVLTLLQNNKPVTVEVPQKIDCEGIICTEIYTTKTNLPAIHTVGYTSDNVGVSGIEKAYEEILNTKTESYVRYICDGKGRILQGVEPEIINQNSPYSNGVVTTIDINIQNILEEVSNELGLGSIIVADAKNSKIKGITSRPSFTSDTISSLLENESSPLFNRALGSYNVGSVFKLCVAAAGIENDFSNFQYNCQGKFDILDRTFRCHEHSGHGLLDLKYAVANSCNTYFYNFAFTIGKESIYQLAKNLNFGKSIKICNGIYTAKSVLPSEEKLSNIAHLANFSIGQGDFLASPISMLTLYSAIANDGNYYMPSIVESTIKEGKEEKYDIGNPTNVFTQKTANILKEALKLVIDEGTGILAKPKTVTAAGKTATAQTGKYKNGHEINSSWFCGFFPIKNPKYVVIVFCEDNSLQTKSCAEIFAEIADKITVLP